MNSINSMCNLVSGMYIAVDLLSALGLWYCAKLMKSSGRNVPTLYTASVAIALDLLSVVLHVACRIFGLQGVWLDYFFPLLDLMTVGTFVLAGISLITAKPPSRKSLCLLGVSGAAVYLLCVFGRNMLLFNLCTMVWMVTLFADVVVRVRRYNQSLAFYYSNVDKHRTAWFAYILLWGFVVYPLYKLISIGVDRSELLYIVYMLLSMSIILVLSYKLVSQVSDDDAQVTPVMDEYNAIHSHDTSAAVDERAEVGDYMSSQQQHVMRQRLNVLMKEEHLYRQPDLSVADLAKRLDTNPSYFYYFMRDVMNSSFFDYINSFRIEEAKEMLVNDEKIDYICVRVGFNSDSTFRRAFKKATGVTPTEWRKGK